MAGGPHSTLLERCLAGEHEAWRHLHREYQPVAMAFLVRLGLTRQEAEDACQDVFIQVFRYLSRFEGRAEFKTWFYRLCWSRAERTRRRARLWSTVSRLWGTTQRTEAQLSLSEGEAERRVAAALSQMKPEYRGAFVLYELEGLSGKEIAEVLGCPVATVWRRLHYARAQFVEHFERSAFQKGQK
jgi:RNA polymerase sigma-70 factor (ECF subfamily)